MRGILRFTLVMGALSSVFDFVTFGILLGLFHSDAAQFRTAWFVESLVSQILVIFIIRTYRTAWRGRPHPVLVMTSLVGAAVALFILLTPLRAAFGFVVLGGPIAITMSALVVCYLGAAEGCKQFAAARPAALHGAPLLRAVEQPLRPR
jgi:P-type Mg2+ transporter